MIREPDTVFGAIEDEPGRRHAPGIDLEQARFAPALADDDRQLWRDGEMNVMPLALDQAMSAYGWQVTFDRAVEQNVGWRCWRKRQVYLHGVPLVGANHRTVGAERESLLVAGGDERLEVRSGQGPAVTFEGMEELDYGNPTTVVEREADSSWLVA